MAAFGAAISPSLTAKSRLETCSQEFSHLDDTHYVQVHFSQKLQQYLFRQTTTCFAAGTFLICLKIINCMFSTQQQCALKSPAGHRTVSIPSTLNIHLLCPALAMATVASRSACLSPVGPRRATAAAHQPRSGSGGSNGQSGSRRRSLSTCTLREGGRKEGRKKEKAARTKARHKNERASERMNN